MPLPAIVVRAPVAKRVIMPRTRAADAIAPAAGHERRAGPAHHLAVTAHAGRIHHGRGALVAGPTLAVAARDQEHGGAVGGRARDHAHADADRGAFDGRGVAGAGAEGRAVLGDGGGGGGRGAGVGVGGAAEGGAGHDGYGGVDHRDDDVGAAVRVVVQLRLRSVQVETQVVDHVGWDVGRGESGDVA